ncbi:MAG: hypothetical protein ACK5RL_10885 [Acidimicrobiales bacterium]
MIRSTRASLMQLTSRNYLLAGLGCSFVLALVTVMLYVGSTDEAVEERGPLGDSATPEMIASSEGLALALGSTISLVGLVLMAVSASAVASDYSTGMIRILAVRQPGRFRLIAGKALALALATLVATALVVATTIGAAVAFAPSDVDTGQWFTSAGLRALAEASVNYFVAALGWVVFGQFLATVTRSAVVALATGVLVAIPLDLVLTDTVESTRPWLPGQLFQAVARGGTRNLEYGSSLATVMIAGFLLMAVSFMVFHRRDITA